MNSAARSRLAAQAAAAGYPPDLLALIANATLPRYRPGEQLEDAQIEQVTDAVEVLAQAGYPRRHPPRSARRLPAPPRRATGASGSGPGRCGSRASATATPTATASRPARPTPTGSPARPRRRRRRAA